MGANASWSWRDGLFDAQTSEAEHFRVLRLNNQPSLERRRP